MMEATGMVEARRLKARESRCRRELRKLGYLGYVLRKSRVRPENEHLDNMGGYMIVDPYTNFCVAGQRYELDLEDVEQWLEAD